MLSAYYSDSTPTLIINEHEDDLDRGKLPKKIIRFLSLPSNMNHTLASPAILLHFFSDWFVFTYCASSLETSEVKWKCSQFYDCISVFWLCCPYPAKLKGTAVYSWQFAVTNELEQRELSDILPFSCLQK